MNKEHLQHGMFPKNKCESNFILEKNNNVTFLIVVFFFTLFSTMDFTLTDLSYIVFCLGFASSGVVCVFHLCMCFYDALVVVVVSFHPTNRFFEIPLQHLYHIDKGRDLLFWTEFPVDDINDTCNTVKKNNLPFTISLIFVIINFCSSGEKKIQNISCF